MKRTNYDKLMDELRTLYKERKFHDLKKKYLLSRWMIKPEDRKNIEKVIYIALDGEQSILELAQKEMGGEITPIDK